MRGACVTDESSKGPGEEPMEEQTEVSTFFTLNTFLIVFIVTENQFYQLLPPGKK